jgi:ATP-dependent DNA helicase RecG
MPLVTAAVEDVDEALVWSYIRDLEGDAFREPDGFPTAVAMRDLRLAADYGGSITPSLAGFLLFGRSAPVQQIVPQSQITLTRFSGSDTAAPVVERAEFCGNLTRLFDNALFFLKRYVDLWDTRPPRTPFSSSDESTEPIPPRANYSRPAVIEGLTNLLVHRDYSVIGSSARVMIFDDRLELINPSRTNGTTRKSIELGATEHINPRLHHVFTSQEYGIERATRGIPALRRAHTAIARREPRISLLGDEFRLELYGI